ncbi:MAG: hypothetical protein KAX69_03130, partial [Chitinophagales bacterium]|nr:hypothetical protein [Chitinophagales bacterium]
AILQLSKAQNNPVAKKQIPAKKLSVKELNALETEKIKALIAGEKPKKDTLPEINPQTTIAKEIKKDSLKDRIKTPASVKNILPPNDKLKKDTAVRKDTLNIIKPKQVIINEVKKDSVKATAKIPTAVAVKKSVPVKNNAKIDSVVRKVIPINIAEEKPADITENKPVVKPAELKPDTLPYRVYTKSERLADSIKKARKHWLDSTLMALPKSKPVVMKPDDEIEIFISGGGLYTGVNPTVFNRLTIYNSGLVHKETKTKLQGENTEDKKISRDELRKLAQYIIDQGFFDFNYLYDCDSKDKDCNTRLKMSPEPSPLSVVVTVGARRKKIYVALYAPHMESNWVNYPASLEKIVNAIYSVAEK